MRIKFEKLTTINGKVYVNFGNGFKEYEINEVKDSGITIPEDCTDYSSIQIKGSSVILNNLDVISNIKTSDDNAISPEDITGIVLKDFNGKFDKSLLRKYPSLNSISIPNGVTSIGIDAFNNCTSLTSITIPDGVTSISTGAFSYCSSLTSITIPDSVTSIGMLAFDGCSSLTSITIPDGVTSIADYTFSGCLSLTSITIPDSVTSIGEFAFDGCSSLTSITIPESVTSIGSEAFYNCKNLKSIVIPNSVTKIGEQAFNGCSSLKTINYTGTEEQWNAISKGYLWNFDCPSSMVINYNYAE